jgi:hypothetical protein
VGLPTRQHRTHVLLNASLRQLLVVISALSDLDLLADFWTFGNEKIPVTNQSPVSMPIDTSLGRHRIEASSKLASEGDTVMSGSVAKVIELTSSSSKSIEDAVERGIARADATLDEVEGAWIQDIKCLVKNGKVVEWRVNMKVTFILADKGR